MTESDRTITPGTLAAIETFRALSIQKRQKICPLFNGHVFQRGEVIIEQRSPGTTVYFLVSGAVRVRFFSKSGREITFRDLSAGRMFGELAAIDDKPRSAQVISRSESFVLSLEKETFRQLLFSHPEVSDYVLRHLATSVRSMTERVIEFSSLGVKNRIHVELLRLVTDELGVPRDGAVISSTHSEIASRVSTTREAVTREINELTQAAVLEKRGRGSPLVVIDVRRLEEIVRQSAGDLPTH